MNGLFHLKKIFSAAFILVLVMSFGMPSVVQAEDNPPAEPPIGDEPSEPPPENQSRRPEPKPDEWILDPLEEPGFIRFDIAPSCPHRFYRIPEDDRDKEPRQAIYSPSTQISPNTKFLPLLIGSSASATAYNQSISALSHNSYPF